MRNDVSCQRQLTLYRLVAFSSELSQRGRYVQRSRRPVSIADFSGSMVSEGTRDKTHHPAARAAAPPNRREHEARTARRHAPTSTGHPRSTMDPTAALNILQNHARQKQTELAQTPPQQRRTSNVAHARSWRASTRRSRTWRASSTAICRGRRSAGARST